MLAGYLQFKPEFCNTDANIKKIAELTGGINFDLLVMPELASSGYLFISDDELSANAENIPDGKFCRYLRSLSKTKNAHIVCGIAESSGGKYYNSSVLVSPDGIITTYRKIHLFYEEKKWFTPGNIPFSVKSVNINGEEVKLGMMICYDWIYPESVRSLSKQGAQLICHSANLVMPYCQNAMFARAVENRVFVITSNRTGEEINGDKKLNFTGQSVILDPKGNYLHRGTDDKDEVVIVDINPADADDKKMNEYNSIFEDIRNDMYTL